VKNLNKLIAISCLLLTATSVFAEDDMATKDYTEMMEMCDTDKDGKISKVEYTNEKMKKFDEYDKDNDDALNKTEYQTMSSEIHKMLMDADEVEE
jgi:Ca2+-binding EF-hand superfamily protein